MKKEDWIGKIFDKIPMALKELGIPKLFLLVLAGIFLLLSSGFPAMQKKEIRETSTNIEVNEKDEVDLYIENQENKLKKILENMYGVQSVEVMITAKSTREKVALKDIPYSRNETVEQDSGGGTRENTQISSEENTVKEKGENGQEVPYITKEIQPQIEGVVVIVEGLNEEMITEINDAIKALFNVPAHKIKVMKMK